MDDILAKNKKLFVTVGVILGVLALWHLYYVRTAIDATGHEFLLNEYGMLALGLSMLALCAGIFMICTERRMEVIWIITLALLGISSIRVMPGLSAADEPVHYVTAYYWSDKLMMTQAEDDAGRVLVRAQDFALEDADGEIDKYYAGEIDNTRFFGMEPLEYNYYESRNWDELHPAEDVVLPGSAGTGQAGTAQVSAATEQSVTVQGSAGTGQTGTVQDAGGTGGIPQGTAPSHIVRAETTPLVYIPQIMGITIARSIGGNSMMLVTMGKIFNLLAFCVLVYIAVGLMPFGKELMMASTLLPMTVNLAASMSYDAMLIGCAYLFIAMVMRLAYEPAGTGGSYSREGTAVGASREEMSRNEAPREKMSMAELTRTEAGKAASAYGEGGAAAEGPRIGWKDVAVLCGILVVMSPCKMVYCVMAALLLLIPKERFGGRGRMIAIWAACIVCALGSVLAVNAVTIGKYAAATSNELVWTGGEEGYTAAYVIRHPVETLRMVYDTFVYNGGYYHQTMIGGYLGGANEGFDVPYIIVMLLTAGLVVMPLVKPGDDRQLGLKDKLVIVGVGAVILGLLMGSMLIGWTPLSSSVILGVQGRYMLPLLPVLLLLVRNKWLVTAKDMTKVVLFLMTACDAYALFRMYSVVCLHI